MSSGAPPNASPFVRGTTTTSVFVLQAGTRRLIPDADTLKFLAAGQQVRTLSDADLAAIPQGLPLPSRANGTVLAARTLLPPPSRPVFLMVSGQRRRIPDIETLTGIVTSGTPVREIDPADLAAIPEGALLLTRREGTV